MLIPYIGETGALIVAAVLLFVVAPLAMLAFVRWGTRPIRPPKATPPPVAWRRVNQPWGEE